MFSRFLNCANGTKSRKTSHMKKANYSFCPRRRDFNSLYKEYCVEEFGGKKRNKMFDQLEGKFSEYKEKHPSCKLRYQLFNPERQKPRIIVIVLMLMSRIHTEVCFLHLKVLPVMILSENKKK